MNVIWWNASRGNWDHGLLQGIFDKHPETFIQFNTGLQSGSMERCIVVVTGKPQNESSLNDFLLSVNDPLVILTSDEDSGFNWKRAIPRTAEIWTQYYWPNKSEIKERLLLGVPNRFKDYKVNSHLPKKYLWSFVGQVQNPYRQECVKWLKTMPDGFLHIADSFGGIKNGIEYQEYLDIMCQSKFVICPSGSMSADCFRVYEAMECGAIPIVNTRCPRDKADFYYWNEVYPANQLSFVEHWNDVQFLNSNPVEPGNQNAWWLDYKIQLENKLLSYANTI